MSVGVGRPLSATPAPRKQRVGGNVLPVASRPLRALLAGSLALVAGVSVSTRAYALDVWEAPPECPTRAQAERRIAELAGRPLRAERTTIRVVAESGGYRASITMPASDGGARERQLTAESCELVVEAAAVVLVASQAEVATPRPAPPRPWNVWIAARPTLDGGLLPAAVLGGAIDVGVGREALRGELRLGAMAPAEATSSLGTSAEIHALSAEAAFCAARPVANVRLGACAGFSFALLRGRGVEVDRAQQEDRLVPAPKLGLDARWPANGRLAVRFDAVARVALARPEFVVLNDAVLHRPSVLAAQVAIGPEMRF